MIITIGRECGCRGDSVGKALAKKFNIPFYDKNAIKELAKKSGAYDKYPNFFAEKPVNSLIYSIAIEFLLMESVWAILLSAGSLSPAFKELSFKS